MGYCSLRECLADLHERGDLVTCDYPIDPYLEVAEVQRRLYRASGKVLLFTQPRGCRFPLLLNLYGRIDRVRFLFRESVDRLQGFFAAVRRGLSTPRDWSDLARFLPRLPPAVPRYVDDGPVLDCRSTISQLPHITCWPLDGGAFITLPVVYSENRDRPGWFGSNLGMYRVQLSGNAYLPDRQIGVHYQLHRGMGVHHAAALRRGEELPVTIAVGGPPALPLAAVMPLPETVPEVAFAGVLGNAPVRLIRGRPGAPLFADADFCITGSIIRGLELPEGPFGDHLGYYAKQHPFPVLRVDRVYHRRDAIWPLTVVGRPPQEDTMFGQFIHELTGAIIPKVLPGVHAVHAVDAAGVHPLLLAIGSERYVPYAKERQPQELLTIGSALLGHGQLSLAKYLFLIAKEDAPDLDIHDLPQFFRHWLERIDWRRDLHFITNTTIDTLDYSGTGFQSGSKLLAAAAGPARRNLATTIPASLCLPFGFRSPRVALPGILCIEAPPYTLAPAAGPTLARCDYLAPLVETFPLLTLVDDAEFTARNLDNWLWVTFTRSNPATDLAGVGSAVVDKHWGCRGPLIIDARRKPHHSEPCVEDPAVSKRVDALAAPGGPLHGLLG